MVINNNSFPIPICLFINRLKSSAEIPRVIVGRNYYGNKRVRRVIHTDSTFIFLVVTFLPYYVKCNEQNRSKLSTSDSLLESLTAIFNAVKFLEP